MIIKHYKSTLQGTEPAWVLSSCASDSNLYPQDIFLIKILKYKAQNINSIELLNYQFWLTLSWRTVKWKDEVNNLQILFGRKCLYT